VAKIDFLLGLHRFVFDFTDSVLISLPLSPSYGGGRI